MARFGTTELKRLENQNEGIENWMKWGPYVSNRAWGTVREDYSEWGDAWEYFPYDHAKSRAYRWNEDGIGGICNLHQNMCLAPAFWNGKDDHIKERFFGLTNGEGNHGEDVKEYYFYIDNTPTHSYMKMLYKYPQVEFPYEKLKVMNKSRSKEESEFELIDALHDEFMENKYFDIFIEYAKYDVNDIVSRITAINRNGNDAHLHILPHLWFRNNWHWGYFSEKPTVYKIREGVCACEERHLGKMFWFCQDNERNTPTLYFTENETNFQKLYNMDNISEYVKDGINEAIVHNDLNKVNPKNEGTKAAAHFHKDIGGYGTYIVYIRLTDKLLEDPFADIEEIFNKRMEEADDFYDSIHDPLLDDEERLIQREAFAGLLWTKQFYHYSPQLWYTTDPESHALNPLKIVRKHCRNERWKHLFNMEIISMPDKWEYPWYAVWDLAFHTIPFAMIDPTFAKNQLLLFLREDYMHPNGQIPAYEWNFEDVNPPVHAWAVWRVYNIDKTATGTADIDFLKRAFHKLLLNFTWWVNRKDVNGNNVFEGGFLGMDNIGVFDRSHQLPTGGSLEQADGTAWMAMYCLNLLAIALELALHTRAYEDMAIKFFDHFIFIANTMSSLYNEGRGLWDDENGFFFDVLKFPDNSRVPLKVMSFVGLIPLFAVEVIEEEWLRILPRLNERIEWYMRYRKNMIKNIAPLSKLGQQKRRLLSVVDKNKLQRILRFLTSKDHFLSDYGLRTLSKSHAENPYIFSVNYVDYTVTYEPAESRKSMFGGNSNWRGPIWFPVNFLMLESLQKFSRYYGNEFTIEYPANSGNFSNLQQITLDLSKRLCQIFLKDKNGRRPLYGASEYFHNSDWCEHILFYEYFNGDTGEGLGASHQTGWTALVAKLLQQCGGTITKYRSKSIFLRPS